jgi:hypothetical protein
MAKTNSIIPENETRNEKFIRIAGPRVNAIIDKLGILENCAGASYEYSGEQVDAMFSAIRNAVDACEAKFQPKAVQEKEKFTF